MVCSYWVVYFNEKKKVIHIRKRRIRNNKCYKIKCFDLLDFRYFRLILHRLFSKAQCLNTHVQQKEYATTRGHLK